MGGARFCGWKFLPLVEVEPAVFIEGRQLVGRRRLSPGIVEPKLLAARSHSVI
jgi:hypothetical protein